MAHPLIDEIRGSECWRLYKLRAPESADRFLNRIIADLPVQWRAFLRYKELHKEEMLKGAMTIGGGKQTGVMPEVYATWCAFSRPKFPNEIPMKTWLRQFIIKHPILWLDENAYTGKLDKNI